MSRMSKAIVFLLLLQAVLFAQSDVPGSKDHPLISRYPRSVIAWYDVQNFDHYKIATGPVSSYRHIEEWVSVEGKVTRIYYTLSGSHSVTEVYYNYLQAIKKAGFEVLAEGLYKSRNIAKKIGGRGWLGVYYAENSFPTSSKIQLLNGSATSGGSCFVAGKLKREGRTAYVAMGGTQYNDQTVLFMVDIIEVQALEDDLVTVDADAMSRDIAMYGKVALYGIYFDFDKATLKPESDAALKEITRLLKKNPGLTLYVVGHTDMKGGLAYNMSLSQKRAAAVVEALSKRFGIKSARLSPMGVGPLVPVLSNKGEAGRAKNRRVELVEK